MSPPPLYWPAPFNTWQTPQFGPWMTYPAPGFTPRQSAPRPTYQQNPEANIVDNGYQPTRDFAEAFSTMSLTEPSSAPWYMDSGATAHLASSPGILHSVFNLDTRKSVIVGNGSSIPILSAGSVTLPSKSRPLSLNNVLVTPKIIKISSLFVVSRQITGVQ